MSCKVIQLPNSLSHPGPWEMIECKEKLIEFKGYNIILIYHWFLPIVSQLLYFVSLFSQSGLLKSNHISLIFGSCEHSEYMYMELLRSCEHSEYMYMELLRSCEHSEYMYMELLRSCEHSEYMYMELLRSWKNKKDGWFGLWCLTPLSTISVISCQTVLLVEETFIISIHFVNRIKFFLLLYCYRVYWVHF
jgi:hypothetical protein